MKNQVSMFALPFRITLMRQVCDYQLNPEYVEMAERILQRDLPLFA